MARVHVAELHPHERIVEERVEGLVAYLQALDDVVIPCVVACRRTGMIIDGIDGHHRHAALQRMGWRFIPVLYVDYDDARIADANGNAKSGVLKRCAAARTQGYELFAPKTTRHVIETCGGHTVPLLVLAPLVCMTPQTVECI